ncbi:MAG: DUF4920 domain-containing protein [Planctomycetota bacterium]|jgi:hypothetical protein
MNVRAFSLVAVYLAVAGCASTGSTTPYKTAQQDGWSHYGSEPRNVGAYVALGALQGDERNIVVEGVITETCTTSGCWAKIVDKKGHEIIVLTEESRFHLPRNCAGHRAVAHGNMEVREISVEQRRHYAEVAGASPDQIAAITEPQHSLLLIADSVYLEGEGFVDAYSVQEAEAACKAQLEKEINR